VAPLKPVFAVCGVWGRTNDPGIGSPGERVGWPA